MKKIELVELIGDVLTQLDVLVGSMDPDDDERKPFIKNRKALDKMQLQLVQSIWNENTQKYKDAAKELEEVNDDLQETIGDLDELVKTLENVNRFVGVVDKIIQTVMP